MEAVPIFYFLHSCEKYRPDVLCGFIIIIININGNKEAVALALLVNCLIIVMFAFTGYANYYIHLSAACGE